MSKKRYFKIRESKIKNENSFTDYLAEIPNVFIKNVSVSDCVKKKIIHEYPNKQGFLDLSYYFDDVDIYEKRIISLTVNVVGEGATEIDRENSAHSKLNELSQYILDKTNLIDISILKYDDYFFTGVPLSYQIKEKNEKDILGLLEVVFEFLVYPEAKKMINGYFPIEIFKSSGIGSFLHTDFDLNINNEFKKFKRDTLYFYLKKKKPITIYKNFNTEDKNSLLKDPLSFQYFSFNINGSKKDITKKDIEVDEKRGIFIFTINSVELEGGINFIEFIYYLKDGSKDDTRLHMSDFYLILESNKV